MVSRCRVRYRDDMLNSGLGTPQDEFRRGGEMSGCGDDCETIGELQTVMEDRTS